ncbi:hypothetical protein PSPO01_04031 [Paraphaeosphaeria sporulosa]
MSDTGPPVPDMKILTADEFPAHMKTQRTVARYNSSTEAKPEHPFWALPEAGIDSTLNSISEKLAKILEGIPTGDRELEHLKKTIYTIAQIKRSPAITIGLVGEQGAGKSMTINAVFDTDGISWSGADGVACTSAVVKYSYYTPSSTSETRERFCADVKFLSEEKIEAMIREQVKYLKRYHDDADDSDDEEPRGPQSYDQDEVDKRLCKTATDIFKVLFGSEKAFLRQWTSQPTDEFVYECKIRCKEAMRSCHVADGSDTCTRFANCPRDLMSRIRHFLADVKGIQCLWPLVDHVNIRFDHELLKYGLVLIDVPGSGDTNMARARHIEEIKDIADVVFVFADTLRIGSDHAALGTVRACSLNRGRKNVKFVATKIDALLKNDLENAKGAEFDHIRRQIQKAGDEARAAEDDGEDAKVLLIGQYATYLERQLLLYFVNGRARNLSNTIRAELNDRGADESVKIFHISASNYLEWQAKPMIRFRDQPPLPPSSTGIPEIRRYLYSLVAPKNLSDVARHLNSVVPNYFGKIERVINESDRNADFGSLAREFDQVTDSLIDDLLSQAKQMFEKILKETLAKLLPDTAGLKKQIDEKLRGLCKLNGRTLNKIMKFRGTLPPRASQAKGLEKGCSYNRDFSNILAPAFLKWAYAYAVRIQPMRQALIDLTALIARAVLHLLDVSSANVMVVEKAKRKWIQYRISLKAKMEAFMDTFEQSHKKALVRATMEEDRQNCLVATITDAHFDAVFAAEPALKPGCHPAKPKYVESKGKFQQRMLLECFSDPNSHFVDHVFKLFHDERRRDTNILLDGLFRNICDSLEAYSSSLKDESTISYQVERGGLDIRANLERAFPDIKKEVARLQGLLTEQTKAEEQSAAYLPDLEGAQTLAQIYARLSRKRKQGAQDGTKAKIKKERV